MKKILLGLLGVIIALLLLVFIVLFTAPGNAIIKPIIQSQIDKYAPIKLDLETFALRISSINVLIQHTDKIDISLTGDFSLFSQTLDLNLKVDAKDISVLGELAGTDLQGSFLINTTAKGTLNHIEINTTSDIAKSFTDIRISLQNYIPVSILASIKDMQIKEILAMIGQKPYAGGSLNLDADITGNEEMNFNGNALLNITQGLVDSALIQKDFEIEVPKTTFVITFNALFDTDTLNHNFNFNSNIGNILSSGKTSIKELLTQSDYDIKLSDLSAFTPLAGMPIRGNFNAKGTIEGNMEELFIKGSSDIAASNMTYNVQLKDLSPYQINAKVSNLRLDTILWMIYMPQYATMYLNLDSVLSDFDKGISTTSTLTLKGTTSHTVIKKEMDLDMPSTNFTLNSDVKLTQGIGKANSTLKSDMANIGLKETQINLNDFVIQAPYEAIIPDLKKLKFITGIELAGEFKAQGKAKIADTLYADFNTASLGGSIDAILDNNQFNAKLKDINTLKLFTIAQMKPVFSSSINGDLDYNLLSEKGTLKARISNGKLMQSDLTDTVAKYLKFDITQEIYDDAGLNALIDQKRITADIDLKSSNTSISAKGASLDLENDTLNADMKFQIKDKYVYLKATNKISQPSIKLDASDLIKDQATKAVTKEVNKALDKYIKNDETKDAAKNLIQNLLK